MLPSTDFDVAARSYPAARPAIQGKKVDSCNPRSTCDSSQSRGVPPLPSPLHASCPRVTAADIFRLGRCGGEWGDAITMTWTKRRSFCCVLDVITRTCRLGAPRARIPDHNAFFFCCSEVGQYLLPIGWWSRFNLPTDVVSWGALSWLQRPVPGSSWSCSGDSIPWVLPDSTPPDRYFHHSLPATTETLMSLMPTRGDY
jgi:hypothetical protein